MYKKYKVSFTIQGNILEDDFMLNKKNVKLTLDREFNAKSQDYYGNRNLDTIKRWVRMKAFPIIVMPGSHIFYPGICKVFYLCSIYIIVVQLYSVNNEHGEASDQSSKQRCYY